MLRIPQNQDISRCCSSAGDFYNFILMDKFKERKQTDSDSGLYYLEPPQYYYEQGRSFNLRQRQTTGDHCLCDTGPNCVCDLSAEVKADFVSVKHGSPYFKIGYLMRRAKEMQEFVCFWLEFGERIGNMVMAGDVEL